jgi:cell division protein FtsW
MASRAQRGLISDWLWTVDRTLLFAIGALMVAGLVLGIAASPAVADRLPGIGNSFHFVHRQVAYVLLSVPVMIGVSFLNPRYVRRLALLILVVAMAGVVATLLVGAEIKGAKRWLNFPVLGTVQPSEFVKPAFVLVAAWAFAEGARRADMPGTVLAILLLPAVIVPLMLQPDIGQTMLIAVVWCGLFFLAGLHIVWVAGLGAMGGLLLLIAYRFYPHVAGRIDRFLHDKGSQDSFQVDLAIDSFQSGGLLGKGPGEGTIKRTLPDAHTDFIFAVTAEEFGALVCLLLVGLFALVVLRTLWLAYRSADPFCRFAAAGLGMLFGTQAFINLAVNLHLVPPKGMTLPFISYGGSSLLSLAIGAGFLLAVTRRRPRLEEMPPEAMRTAAAPALAGGPARA